MAFFRFSIIVLFWMSSNHVFPGGCITDVALRFLEVYKSERDFSFNFIQISLWVSVWEDNAYLFLLAILIHDNHLFHFNWAIMFRLTSFVMARWMNYSWSVLILDIEISSEDWVSELFFIMSYNTISTIVRDLRSETPVRRDSIVHLWGRSKDCSKGAGDEWFHVIGWKI